METAYVLVQCKIAHEMEILKALLDVNEKVISCSECGGITEIDPCYICTSPKRDKNILKLAFLIFQTLLPMKLYREP